MNCSDFSERLSLYADGELRGPEAGLFEEHLASCSHCAGQFQYLRVLQGRAAEALEQPREVPDIADSVMMLMVGYALRLGFNDAQIGLISTVPMLCVLAQLLSSRLIGRGASRRRMTIFGDLLSASGWSLIILLPILVKDSTVQVRVLALVSAVGAITIFGQIATNARASWLGDLVPSDQRGGFFGHTTMYSGIVGSAATILGGVFLDHMKYGGVGAFLWVFGFGMLCGLFHALLFIPQPDMPAAQVGAGEGFLAQMKGALRNRAFILVTAYAVVWMLQMIASPFYAAYLLRDLRMSFLGFSLVSIVGSVFMLVSSPVWGKIVDRFGCKPVLVVCTALVAPLPLIWIWTTTARAVFIVTPAANVLGGIGLGGITVALNTLVYKSIPDAGRAFYLAMYSIAVLLLPAPMPVIGGYLPGWLRAIGIHADLRVTFFATIPILIAALLIACKIQETDARGARELVTRIAGRLHHQGPRQNGPSSED